jgi:hypothetical protein
MTTAGDAWVKTLTVGIENYFDLIAERATTTPGILP